MVKTYKGQIEDVILYLNKHVEAERHIQILDLYGSQLTFEVIDDQLGTVAHAEVLEREVK